MEIKNFDKNAIITAILNYFIKNSSSFQKKKFMFMLIIDELNVMRNDL